MVIYKFSLTNIVFHELIYDKLNYVDKLMNNT